MPSLSQLWEEEEKMTELPVMGAPWLFVIEDPEITMENIFGEIHPEEQHVDMIPLAVEREEAKPDVTTTEAAAPDQGQEEGLPVGYSTTSAVRGPPSAPDVSPTWSASSSSSCHYAKLSFVRYQGSPCTRPTKFS